MNIRIKGALTVEASIVMPIFILAILSLAMFLRVLYAYEIVGQAVDNVANDMATLTYLYDKSSLLTIQKDIDSNLQTKAKNASESIDTITQEFNNLLNDGTFSAGDIFDSINYIINDKESLLAYPIDQGYEILKTKIGSLLAGALFNRYLSQDRLSSLYIEQFNFDSSRFLYTTGIYNNQIDLIASYKIAIPDPLNILGDIDIRQGITVRAWTGKESNECEPLVNNDDEVKVYIVGNGTKYHKSSCNVVSKKVKMITLEQAKLKGYKSCDYCRNKANKASNVYVTRYGQKYHHKSCRFINPDVKTITLSQAKDKGYRPCKLCKP